MSVQRGGGSSSGGSGSATPTLIAAGVTFAIPANTQVVYGRKIVLQSGAKILIGSNAVLYGVS